MIEVAIIADDLTGAADTAIQFSRVGAPVLLVSHQRLPAGRREFPAGTLAVYTDSRHLPPAEASARVGRAGLAIKELAPGLIYKKIDSGLRGNIGAEVSALTASLGCEGAFLAPAFPAQGRTTRHGVHFVRGIPVAASEMARDPVSPVQESRLARLVARQTTDPVGRIEVTELGAGLEPLRAAVNHLWQQGRRLIVFDATIQRHLELIARLARRHFPQALLAGSAGLALALAQCLTAGKEPPPDRGGTASRLLFVCGSGSEVLTEQVEALVAQAGVPRRLLEPRQPGTGPGEPADGGMSLAGGAAILQLAAFAGEGPQACGRPASEACRGLALAAAEAIRQHRPEVLFLCGGDTAAGVLDALGATGVWLQSEILPGLVKGRIRGGDCDGLLVITKAGAFGERDTLVQLYAILTAPGAGGGTEAC